MQHSERTSGVQLQQQTVEHEQSMSQVRGRVHKADLAALIVGARPFMSGSVLSGSVMGGGGPGGGVQPLSSHPVCFSN